MIYATLIFMSISGLSIHFDKELHITKEFINNIKELHELIAYVLVYFVPLHIAGVFVAENKNEAGLVSSMISGK